MRSRTRDPRWIPTRCGRVLGLSVAPAAASACAVAEMHVPPPGAVGAGALRYVALSWQLGVVHRAAAGAIAPLRQLVAVHWEVAGAIAPLRQLVVVHREVASVLASPMAPVSFNSLVDAIEAPRRLVPLELRPLPWALKDCMVASDVWTHLPRWLRRPDACLLPLVESRPVPRVMSPPSRPCPCIWSGLVHRIRDPCICLVADPVRIACCLE